MQVSHDQQRGDAHCDLLNWAMMLQAQIRPNLAANQKLNKHPTETKT